MADVVQHKFRKVSMKLTQDAMDALNKVAQRRGIPVESVLSEAIGTRAYLEDVIDQGGKILVEDRKGQFRQLHF